MHPVTLRVLIAVSARAANGNAILRRLQRRDHGRGPSLPTLYRCLREATERGWIVAATEETGRQGRPRQHYRITRSGTAAARSEARRLRALAAEVLDETTAEAERS